MAKKYFYKKYGKKILLLKVWQKNTFIKSMAKKYFYKKYGKKILLLKVWQNILL
jgi:hypothetical protein